MAHVGGRAFARAGKAPLPESAKSVEFFATDAIKTLLPACVALVVDVWSDMGDINVVSAIDRDGCDLLNDYTLGSDGERVIEQAMSKDIETWLKLHRMSDVFASGERLSRLWQWTQSQNIRPIGPFQPLQYVEEM